MDNYVNGIAGVLKIQNKADAMQFAINKTMTWKCGESCEIDYDEAKKLFDFICENVEFPADVNKLLVDELHQMVQILSETQNSKSFLDRLFKSHDLPNAAAMCADADMSTLEDAIFRPKIKEGEWHCNKVNPPYKDLPMAVVRTCDACYDKEVYLAMYSEEEKEWRDIYRNDVIDDVTHYFIMPQPPID